MPRSMSPKLQRSLLCGVAIAAACTIASCGEAPVAAPATFAPAAPSLSLSLGPITDIGSLGGAYTRAAAISSTSMIAGLSKTASGKDRAFVWTQPGGMRDLGTLPGGTYSQATGVNASGQVVGYGDVNGSAVNPHAFLWTAADGMRDLGTLAGNDASYALGINDAGQVVGWSANSGAGAHAFVWSAGGGMRQIDPPGFASSYAYAINNHGVIVGAGTATNASTFQGFVWTSERGLRLLPHLAGGTFSGANAISDAGVIGGSSNFDPSIAQTRAVLWTNGVARDIGNLGGGAVVFAFGPNGEAFGEAYLPSGPYPHGFRWTPTFGMEDITAATGIHSATAVNRELQVVGDRYMVKIRRAGY